MRPLPFIPRGLAALAAASLAAPAGAQWIGPTTYLSAADCPLHADDFHRYFYLEDVEDNLFNVPGVAASRGAPYGPAGNCDSVDGDDGLIDGYGRNGHSFYNNTATPIRFTFDAIALGSLPTFAGVVWTDGVNPIMFEAFDVQGVSLGTVVGNHADGDYLGTTAEDRFYGIVHEDGISAIEIRCGSSIEVDHLQYGYYRCPAIAAGPGDVVACPGGDAVFTVQATGTDLSYQWHKDGDAILGETGGTLIVSGVTTEDEGRYSVVVFNDCEALTSAEGALVLCAADFNCDGTLSLFDFLAFQSAYGNDDVRADLAPPHGVLNLFDFLAFQTAFGNGC